MEYNDDPAIFSNMADTPDTAVFLATDADKARLIRPYLIVRPEAPASVVASESVTETASVSPLKLPASKKLPIYATSRVFAGNESALTNFDLNDLVFVDMPWLLQADHPAVMTYPRASTPLTIDNERLYALGIDAFRLTQLLLNNAITSALPLDGVSGQIQLRGHTFQRTAMQAVFSQGRAQPGDAPITRNADFPYAPPSNP
jgi:outer membrane PBP1 activator LpoA protein